MTRNDLTIVCKDCGRNFIFRADEQNFFAEKGYNEPTRCKDCRAERKNNSNQPAGKGFGGGQQSGRGFSGGQQTGRGFGGGQQTGRFPERETFPAVCASCGKQTQIPFKPKEGRPVFCRDCFQKNK